MADPTHLAIRRRTMTETLLRVSKVQPPDLPGTITRRKKVASREQTADLLPVILPRVHSGTVPHSAPRRAEAAAEVSVAEAVAVEDKTETESLRKELSAYKKGQVYQKRQEYEEENSIHIIDGFRSNFSECTGYI